VRTATLGAGATSWTPCLPSWVVHAQALRFTLTPRSSGAVGASTTLVVLPRR
jgi:hypothetical protein